MTDANTTEELNLETTSVSLRPIEKWAPHASAWASYNFADLIAGDVWRYADEGMDPFIFAYKCVTDALATSSGMTGCEVVHVVTRNARIELRKTLDYFLDAATSATASGAPIVSVEAHALESILNFAIYGLSSSITLEDQQ